jgi:hypothetical protein
MSSLLFDVLVAAFPESGTFDAASTIEGRPLFAGAVFSADLATFPRVVMPSLVFRAMLGGVSGTMDTSISVPIGDLEVLSNSVVSFFFGAIGTSVGVLRFLGGVLTVIESLLKATSPSSSSSLQSLVVLVDIFPPGAGSPDRCNTAALQGTDLNFGVLARSNLDCVVHKGLKVYECALGYMKVGCRRSSPEVLIGGWWSQFFFCCQQSP